MSGLDSNPFADPETANPFEASGTQPAPATSGLEDYNPFADKPAAPAAAAPQPAAPKPQASRPAEIVPSQQSYGTPDPPPAYTSSHAPPRLDTSELQKRQEELEQKAADLREREEQLKNARGPGDRVDNWPPLPQCCGIKPCFYQDFQVDIAVEFRFLVRFMYYLWMTYAITCILNFILAIAYFSAGGTGGATTFGLSILWVLLYPPLSFLCWYRPIYKAFRSDSSINFFCFFIVFFVQIIVNIVGSIGIMGSGYVGFMSASELTGQGTSSLNRGVGGLCFLTAALFTVLAIISIVMLIKIHRLYRNTTASFSKAQAEFGAAVLKDKNVQQAGANAASAAVSNAMQREGNRY